MRRSSSSQASPLPLHSAKRRRREQSSEDPLLVAVVWLAIIALLFVVIGTRRARGAPRLERAGAPFVRAGFYDADHGASWGTRGAVDAAHLHGADVGRGAPVGGGPGAAVPLDRPVPDARDVRCRPPAPTALGASVVLAFRDAPLSALLRSVASVLDRTPPRLLREIILVDDASRNTTGAVLRDALEPASLHYDKAGRRSAGARALPRLADLHCRGSRGEHQAGARRSRLRTVFELHRKLEREISPSWCPARAPSRLPLNTAHCSRRRVS